MKHLCLPLILLFALGACGKGDDKQQAAEVVKHFQTTLRHYKFKEAFTDLDHVYYIREWGSEDEFINWAARSLSDRSLEPYCVGEWRSTNVIEEKTLRVTMHVSSQGNFTLFTLTKGAEGWKISGIETNVDLPS